MIYKITTAAAWNAAIAGGSYTGSADDARDGFIHLSGEDQLQGTAIKYFAHMQDLVLVAFDADELGVALRWEPSRGGQLFPHYYGALPTAAARFVTGLSLDSAGLPRVADALAQGSRS